MHAAKGVMLAFGSRGMPTRGLRADIELSAYLVLAGQRTLTVEDLVERFLHATLPTSDGSGGQLTLKLTTCGSQGCPGRSCACDSDTR